MGGLIRIADDASGIHATITEGIVGLLMGLRNVRHLGPAQE